MTNFYRQKRTWFLILGLLLLIFLACAYASYSNLNTAKASIIRFLSQNQIVQGSSPRISLAGRDLSQTDLRNVDLQGADLSGADLRNVEYLDDAVLTGITYDDETRWPSNFIPPYSQYPEGSN